tara:strand:+ start:2153 stop:2383 length:231 start_codon:yes stop_codon:yes gene_type:complete
MSKIEKIDSIIEWLTEDDGNHAVGEGDIKRAVDELKELKQALNIPPVSNSVCERCNENEAKVIYNLCHSCEENIIL